MARLATYTPDPFKPTQWHAVVVLGLATQRSTDKCFFMIRDPNPLRYLHVVAFDFDKFKSKLISLMYSDL